MISIVLPTYNRSKYIRESIESVLAQTIQDWELIVVDDNSTDETASIVEEYANHDTRITLVRNDTHLELPTSLNKGFSYTKGEYLTWTSDDNIYKPEALSRLLHTFDRDGIGLVFSAMYFIDEKGRIVGHSKKIRNLEDLHHKNIIMASFMFTRKAYLEVGTFDPSKKLVEDFDYWIRLSRKFELKYIDESLYFYRTHNESLSETMKDQVLQARIKLLREEISFAENSHNKDCIIGDIYREIAKSAFFLGDYDLLHEFVSKYHSMSGNAARLPLVISLSDTLGEKAMHKMERTFLKGKQIKKQLISMTYEWKTRVFDHGTSSI